MNLTFSGQFALILGGTCELAVSLARRMIHARLFPVLTYRNETGLKRISEKLAGFTDQFSTAYLDFNDRGSLNRLFEQTGPGVDYLVDFAQGDFESLIGSADEDEIFRYFSENVSFRAAVIKRTARVMLKRRMGRLVYISSTAAARPNPGQGFYAAAKTASEALYRNLGLELGARGISTVTLRPGYVDAGRGRDFLRTHEQQRLGRIPIKRALTVDDVTDAILFYLSDNSFGFNAVAIHLDGGLTAGK